MTELEARRAAAAERRAGDAAALVATIAEGGGSSFRVYAPDDMGIPTVEVRNNRRFDPIMLKPDQAEAIGKALIEAATRARRTYGK